MSDSDLRVRTVPRRMSELSSSSDIPLAVIIGAIITGAVSLLIFVLSSAWAAHQERLARQRRIYAKAFSLIAQYSEYPLVVRRRRTSQREAERIRISSELRKVQEELTFHSAWLRLESHDVAAAYDSMLTQTRAVAGALMQAAWEKEPIESDSAMNLPEIAACLAKLNPARERYLEEVRAEPSLSPKWLHGWHRGRPIKKLWRRLTRSSEGIVTGGADLTELPDPEI